MIDAIIKALPGIAGSLIAGPVGGIIASKATAWFAEKLGVPEEDSVAIQDALSGMDPLKKLELTTEFQRWVISEQNKVYFKELDDLKSARERDIAIQASGARNLRADVLSAISILLVLVLVWMVWKSPDINEYVKGIITLVLGRFLGYIDQIFAFEFGTTRTSRTKDNTIDQLSKGK